MGPRTTIPNPVARGLAAASWPRSAMRGAESLRSMSDDIESGRRPLLLGPCASASPVSQAAGAAPNPLLDYFCGWCAAFLHGVRRLGNRCRGAAIRFPRGLDAEGSAETSSLWPIPGQRSSYARPSGFAPPRYVHRRRHVVGEESFSTVRWRHFIPRSGTLSPPHWPLPTGF